MWYVIINYRYSLSRISAKKNNYWFNAFGLSPVNGHKMTKSFIETPEKESYNTININVLKSLNTDIDPILTKAKFSVSIFIYVYRDQRENSLCHLLKSIFLDIRTM